MWLPPLLVPAPKDNWNLGALCTNSLITGETVTPAVSVAVVGAVVGPAGTRDVFQLLVAQLDALLSASARSSSRVLQAFAFSICSAVRFPKSILLSPFIRLLR